MPSWGSKQVQPRAPKPLKLSPNDWEWEARQLERNVEHHFVNTVYFELAGLFANYALRRVWDYGESIDAPRRRVVFEVFAQCDAARAFCLMRKEVRLCHHRTDPTRHLHKWKVLFGRAAVAFANKLRPKLRATEAEVQAQHQRRLQAVAAKARAEQRLLQRAPSTFDELERLTDP